MQWLIQSSTSFSALDNNTTPLIKALSERGIISYDVGVIPFEHTITGLDKVDNSKPAIAYGSTTLIEEFWKQQPVTPGVFYNKEMEDPRLWIDERSDLLNQEIKEITVAELRSKWIDEPTFVKSVEAKALTGQVLEPVKEDCDRWTIEHPELDGNQILISAPIKSIHQEWRFFIINGEVITGSSYRRNGCRILNDPITKPVWDAANKAAKEWLPHKMVVLDLGLLYSMQYKVIEFNCIYSSGFYKSDVGKIVDMLK